MILITDTSGQLGYSLQKILKRQNRPFAATDIGELNLLDRNTRGLYHMSNDREASKFDQAAYLLNRVGWKGELLRAKSSDFTLAAERPAYSKLNSEKLKAAVGKKIPSWQSGIDRYLTEVFKQ